jgi:hypothetical protein
LGWFVVAARKQGKRRRTIKKAMVVVFMFGGVSGFCAGGMEMDFLSLED